MALLERVKHLFKMCGHALTITVHDRLDAIERELQAAKLMETDAALLRASIHIIENLHALAGRTVVDTTGASAAPEAALLEFLYSHVPARAALEIDGRNSGITTALLRAGYEVYALESGRKGSKTTIARRNGNASTVSAVAELNEVPTEIGLITLGGDPLLGIRDLGDRRASVIAADLTSEFEELLPEMRSREYHWHLMVYRSQDRKPEHPGVSYLSNHGHALPDTQGSVFFFRDYKAFAEAQAWCAATLPRTYLKPRQA